MNPAAPRQLFGEFRPTAYGRDLLPRLTGGLSAAAALSDELAARGLTEGSMSEASDDEDLFQSLPSGRKMVDLGRALPSLDAPSRVIVSATLAPRR